LAYSTNNVEVAIVVKDAGIEQFEFGIIRAAFEILLDQKIIRKLPLRVLVQHLQVRMGRRRIQIVVELFDILAVIAFAVVQPEQALFEDGILAIPHRKRKTKPLLVVAHAGDAVFAPAIGPAAGVIVRKIVPSLSIQAVVFAYGTPLPVAQVRTPSSPGLTAEAIFFHPLVFGGIVLIGRVIHEGDSGNSTR
jgi:hypothetical protein